MKGGRALKVISTILEELQSVCNDISDEEYCSLVSLLQEDSNEDLPLIGE